MLTLLVHMHAALIFSGRSLLSFSMPRYSLLTDEYMSGSFISFRSQLKCRHVSRGTFLTTLSKKVCCCTWYPLPFSFFLLHQNLILPVNSLLSVFLCWNLRSKRIAVLFLHFLEQNLAHSRHILVD